MICFLERNKEPVIEEQYGPDRTILTLALTKKNNSEANHEANEANHEANEANRKIWDIQTNILALLRENPRITQKEIMERTGVSRATIQRTMKALSDNNQITRIGSTRGYWQVNVTIHSPIKK